MSRPTTTPPRPPAPSGGLSRRRSALLLAAALLVTALAAWSARDLAVTTRLEELLPEGSPAAEDYRAFLDTFGGFEKVYALVLWRGEGEPDAALLAAAADRLGEEVGRLPMVAAVRSGLTDADEAFLRDRVLPRAPLFLSPTGAPMDEAAVLARLDPGHVAGRVAEIRRLVTSPGGATQARWLAADPLGFSGGLESLAGGGATPGRVDPMTGAFLSPSGDAALVIITPSVGELDPQAGRELAAGLEAAYGAVRRAHPEAQLDFAAVGGPLYAAQDEAVIRADLVRTLTGSVLVVALLLVAYFGSVGLPVALVAAVAAGVVWTAGLTAALHGEVSVLGLSFAALLLGLGIDYGIHGASRFRGARLAGLAAEAAVVRAGRETGPAILASAASTATAFLVLALAHFRPVREMGEVMAGGIVAILVATAAVGAPALVLASGRGAAARRRPGNEHGTGWRSAPWRWTGGLVAAVVRGGGRRPLLTLISAALLTGLAAWGVARLDLSVDLRALRPTDHPAFVAEELLIERFAVGLDASTVVVRGEDLDAALAAARRVERAVAGLLPPGAEVRSPAAWLPTGEVVERRLAVLAGGPAEEAAAALRRALAEEGLAVAPFAAALEVLDAAARGEAPPPIPPALWPDWVAEGVRGAEGSPGDASDGGAAVALRLSTPLGSWPDGPPPEVLEAIAAGSGRSAAVASVPRLGAELRRVVLRDFRQLGAWALAAVCAVVLLAFRGRPRPALLALVPVCLGSLWTLGLAGWLAVPLDPFTIVVAPLLVGIGIDDGLHALAGARVHGGLVASLMENGRAMTLTTLTTCAGFGSLLASRVPSLRAGGLLVAAGTVFCLVATLWVLPALARLAPGGAPSGDGEAA